MNRPALALLSLLITISSFAEVKPVGTPVPFVCGRQLGLKDAPSDPNLLRATGACRAHLSGLGHEAITISLSNGARSVWTIVASEPVSVVGEVQTSAFDLTLVLQSPASEFVTAGVRMEVNHLGMTTRISGTLPGNIELDVQGFQPVFTTL